MAPKPDGALEEHVDLENAAELRRRLAQVCDRIPRVKKDIAHDGPAILDAGCPVGSMSGTPCDLVANDWEDANQ